MGADGARGDIVLWMLARNNMFEKLPDYVDIDIDIVNEAYEVVKAHIRSNQVAIDQLVDVLMEKDTLGSDEFRAILSEYVEISEEQRETAAWTELATA
ncbi:hypothetical protein E2562_001075 [Oryza meyeriana var. granulata]|uniref:Uncharacterized protein n=1 Tax=Oryza meyeriana var. granulata TaxID=110450 RepID=A0A6G1ED57_9ORYZ|nr:hypothetical protein E2562_001075 [Oryza meyeriana var. granulata]